MIVRHTFAPPNNTRLSHLCGPMDEHLRTIEAALQVSIAHRHEQFKVDGPKAKATRAMEVLQALYEMAARPIEATKVQLMLASDMDLREAEDGALVLRGEPESDGLPVCTLRITREGDALVFHDPESGCMMHYCGARGSFEGARLPYASRRPAPSVERVRAGPEEP